MVTAFFFSGAATTLAVVAATDLLISEVFIAILGGPTGADVVSGPTPPEFATSVERGVLSAIAVGFVGLFVKARSKRVSNPAPGRYCDTGLDVFPPETDEPVPSKSGRPLGGFRLADGGAVEPASVPPPLNTEELRLGGTPSPRLRVARIPKRSAPSWELVPVVLASPAPIVLDVDREFPVPLDGSSAGELPALLAGDNELSVLLDGLLADALPADDEPSDAVPSAWAIPDPLTSAAPTPRVTAPAPSQPYGSG